MTYIYDYVSTEFAKHCVYDVIGLDKDRAMFSHTLTYQDYAVSIKQLLSFPQLTPCGLVTHTINGQPYETKPKHISMYSEACQDGGSKDHVLGHNRPCLSASTPPSIVSIRDNYYNISDDPRVAWGYSFRQRDQQQGHDFSDMSINFTRYIRQQWYS